MLPALLALWLSAAPLPPAPAEAVDRAEKLVHQFGVSSTPLLLTALHGHVREQLRNDLSFLLTELGSSRYQVVLWKHWVDPDLRLDLERLRTRVRGNSQASMRENLHARPQT